MKNVSPWIRTAGLGALLALCLIAPSFGSEAATDARPGFAPRLGICTSPDKWEILKANGFDYIEASVGSNLIPAESDEKFAGNLAVIEGAGFPIEACNGFIPGELKSTGPEADHDAILAFAETAFRRAQRIGIEVIVFGSGGSRGIPEGFDRTEARAQMIALLARMGPVAARYGVTVAVEPLNKKECNFLNTLAEVADVVREAKHPNIRATADMYHMAMENEGPESIVAAGKLVAHCHIAELADRAAPGVKGDDFTGYFRALRQIGYKGRISIECRWKEIKSEAPVAIRTLQEQIERVNAEP
jgi:sugar phosphate isomerase/epimerase